MNAGTRRVNDVIEHQLKVGDTLGDTRSRAEEVLTHAGIGYDYDHFQNRYQSTLRCGDSEGISLYAYLESSRTVSKFEVDQFSYTFP